MHNLSRLSNPLFLEIKQNASTAEILDQTCVTYGKLGNVETGSVFVSNPYYLTPKLVGLIWKRKLKQTVLLLSFVPHLTGFNQQMEFPQFTLLLNMAASCSWSLQKELLSGHWAMIILSNYTNCPFLTSITVYRPTSCFIQLRPAVLTVVVCTQLFFAMRDY